jgi:tetratricopeptide (TPR) repeat protein
LDGAIESVLLSVMAGVTPAEAAADEPLRVDQPLPDTPPYLFLSSVDDWIRVLAVRAVVDDKLRRAGSRLDAGSAQVIRERGRSIAVRLLEEIATLPRMQREAVVLSVWRSDRRWLKEMLLDLARSASLAISIKELFPLNVDESLDSDREIAAYITGEEERGGANVAANRSVARRKLVEANPMFGPLLSSMLPYRKGASADARSMPADDVELARALAEAANDGARAFELLLQGSCPLHQPLLPEYLRAGEHMDEPSNDLAWRSVHAHIVSCGRCNSIVESGRLLSDGVRESGLGDGAVSLDRRVERVVVDLLRRRTGNQLILGRLLAGLTEQADLESETIEELAQIAKGDDELARLASEDLRRWQRHRAIGEPLAPLKLDASPTRGTRLLIVISGREGEWGSLSHDSEGVHLRVSGLPRRLNGKSPRFVLNYDDLDVNQEPRSATSPVEQGSITLLWDDLDERRLRRVNGVTVLPPGPRPSRYLTVGNRLAARTRKARKEGRPLEALSYCYREIALRSKAPTTRVSAEARRRTGAICLELGRLDEAERQLEKAREEADELGEPRVVCDAERGLGEIETRRADWPKATHHIDRALTIARQLTEADRVDPADNERRIATILTSQASLLLDQGFEDDAAGALAAALDIFGRHDDKLGSAAALNVRALAQRRASAHRDALATCRQARELLNAVGTARAWRLEAEIVCTEGRLYHAEGNTKDAMRCFRASLEKMYRVGHRCGEGDAISAIGRVYEALGDTDAAIRSFQRAEEIFTETSDRFRRSAVLGTLARAHLSKAQQSCGEQRTTLLRKAHEEAEESLTHRKTKRGSAISLSVLANIEVEWSRDDPSHRDTARHYYEQAIALRKETGDHRGLAVTLANLAEFELTLQAPERARAHLEDALRLFGQIDNPRAKIVALGVLGDIEEDEGHLDGARTAREKAIELVERVRQDIADADFRRSYFSTSAKYHRELARMLALDDPLGALVLTEASRGRLILERLSHTQAPISYSAASDGPWREGIDVVRGDPNVATLSYLITERGSFLFTVVSGETRATRLEVEPAVLRQQTKELIEAVAKGEPTYPHGEALYRSLLEPAWEQLESCKRLIISPDEVIADLPFELLLTARPGRTWQGTYSWGEDMPYLLKLFAIETVPTLALLGIGHPRRRLSDWSILAPAISPQSPPAWLVAWQQEHRGAGAAAVGNEATMLIASETLRLPSTSCLLVIADSLIEDDRDGVPVPTALIFGDDEPWVIDEIARCETAAEFIVLSADGAANGTLATGEGTISLATAFLSAGARTVCAPTLPVPVSEEVLPLVVAASAAGMRPAEALQEAQLAVSHKGSHPLHWAGWRVMGGGR